MWLDPYPDALLEGLADSTPGPEASYETSESVGLAVRAEIVLRCSDGCSNSQVARELRLTNTTVGKWRSRFVAGGVGGVAGRAAQRRTAAHHR